MFPAAALVSFAAVLASALAAALAALTITRRQRADAETRAGILAALAGASSEGFYFLRSGVAGPRIGSAAKEPWPADFSLVAAGLGAADQSALAAACEALQLRCEPFSLRCRASLHDGVALNWIEISGLRRSAGGAPPDNLIRVTDVSEAVAAGLGRDQAHRRAALYGEALDRLPLRIWWRDAELRVLGGNRAAVEDPRFAAAASPCAATASASGAPHSERIAGPPDIDGAAFLVAESPLPEGGTLGYALDISAEENLRGQLAQMRTSQRDVLESVTTAIAIFAPDTRLVLVNSAFERLWGIEREYLGTEPGMSQLYDHLRSLRTLPEYADYRQFKAQRLALFGTLERPAEELMHLPDGRTIRVRTSRHSFGGLIEAYDDVTDHLALESSFDILSQIQRATIDNLHEGIALFGGDGRLRLSNPAFADLWGIADIDVGPTPHIGVLADSARHRFETPAAPWQATWAALSAQVTLGAETLERVALADDRVLEVKGTPLPDGGMLMTYRDVTDSAQVQRNLEEKNETLAAANRVKSRFLEIVSYELRTPLNAVLGFSEILGQEFFGPLNPQQHDYVRGIIESGNRLVGLIDDILDMASIEAGSLSLDLTPVDMAEMVTQALTLAAERARAQGVEIIVDCPAQGGVILGDDARLRQIVINLMSHALRSTAQGGKITVSVRLDKENAILTVGDSGPALSPESQLTAFETFHLRAETGGRADIGLGLPLVKALIGLHGGEVKLESVEGQGTRIICRLPLLTALPAAKAAPAQPRLERHAS